MHDDFLKECVFRYRCVLLTLVIVYFYWGLDTASFTFSFIAPEMDWNVAFILTCIILLVIPAIFFGAAGKATVLFVAYLLFEGIVFYPLLFICFLFKLAHKKANY